MRIVSRIRSEVEGRRPRCFGANPRLHLAVLLLVAPLVLGATNGVLDVSWPKSSEADLASYVIHWGTQSGNYSLAPATVLKSACTSTTCSRTFTGLDPALTYFFALTAIDEAGNVSGYSPEAWAQPRVIPVCGNSVVETGETCDDGNVVSGDGCSSTCQVEPPPPVCGNRVVETGETCDDGNVVSGDGCSSTCQVEPPPAVCGNRVVETGETCDDGNVVSGDGCSSTCQVEPRAVCGNGVVETGETCDDGNVVSGDGCSSTCQVETLPAPVVSQAADLASGTPYLMQCAQRTVRVSGSNFRSGAVMSFTDTSISVSATTFVSSSELRASVTAAASTPVGAKTVRVTNLDSSSATVSGSQSVEVVKNPDFSRNGTVGAEDFNMLAIAFGSTTGGAKYSATVDMNGNGTINGDDLTRFTPFLGLAVTPCP